MANFDSKDFGERLKNYRLQKGLSQENIATSLGKNKTTISRYEKGHTLISTSVCYSIARKYNISVDYLLGFSNKKYINKAS